MTDPRHHPITDQVRVASLGVLGKYLRLAQRNPMLLTEVRWGADPCKEISESWAVCQAALRWGRDAGRRRDDTSVRVLSVGDGTTPRTAALLAAQVGWSVTAVDPLLRVSMARVRCLPERVEEHSETYDLVLATHSHAGVDATRARVRPGGTLVVLPCCVPWPDAPRQSREVVDYCLSPDRTLVVERRP